MIIIKIQIYYVDIQPNFLLIIMLKLFFKFIFLFLNYRERLGKDLGVISILWG